MLMKTSNDLSNSKLIGNSNSMMNITDDTSINIQDCKPSVIYLLHHIELGITVYEH